MIATDFLYQEAVLEFIEKNKEIDFFILNDELPGEKIEEFTKKINSIKIIILTNKNQKHRERLLENGAYRVLEKNENIAETIINIITEKNYTQELEKEIAKLKQELQQRKGIINKIRNKKSREKNGKIISIVGCNNKNKTIQLFKMFYKFKILQKKILIISTEFINTDFEKSYITKNMIIDTKINKIIFSKTTDEKKKEEIKKFFNEKRKEYDYILVKNSMETFFNINKAILNESDKIYFIIENNIKEIMFSINLLKLYLKDWKIQEEKIEVIINKIKENKLIKKIHNKTIAKIPYKT